MTRQADRHVQQARLVRKPRDAATMAAQAPVHGRDAEAAGLEARLERLTAVVGAPVKPNRKPPIIIGVLPEAYQLPRPHRGILHASRRPPFIGARHRKRDKPSSVPRKTGGRRLGVALDGADVCAAIHFPHSHAVPRAPDCPDARR